MNYSFEYIDIILLAMIAGFIFLRLRGILGKKSEHEEKISTSIPYEFIKEKKQETLNEKNFDENAKSEFLKGAKIAYEAIITNFSKGNLKEIKSLLDKKIFIQFNEALKERKNKGLISEATFVGINSADIKDYKQSNNIFEVTVDFVSEIISFVKDKDKKIISGDPDKIKKVYDTWKFSRDIRSSNPNWLLTDTQLQLNKKISDKDKIDWLNFINSNDKLIDKDIFEKKNKPNKSEKIIDLHGYSLENANKAIDEFIKICFSQKVSKITIITGKGSRSKNKDNPYQSKNFSILKYSVPEHIKNSSNLMKMIKKINFEDVQDSSKGSFEIFLKNFKK